MYYGVILVFVAQIYNSPLVDVQVHVQKTYLMYRVVYNSMYNFTYKPNETRTIPCTKKLKDLQKYVPQKTYMYNFTHKPNV